MQEITREERKTKAAARIFFVDQKSGNPVPGLVVSFFAEPPRDNDIRREEEAPSIPRSRLLSKAQTDASGYVSVKLDLAAIADGAQLAVAYGKLENNVLNNVLRLSVTELLAGNDAYTIQVDASTLSLDGGSLSLSAVMEPDSRDVALSPASIGLTPQLLPGRGLCRQLTPTTLSLRRFEAIHILADLCGRRQEWKCAEPVQIVRGRMLEYDVIWHPAGTALGDLLNSITLAPCEQVNIAVADWMRRETATRTAATDVQQQRFEQTDHDRLITETMNSSVGNKSRAWGVAGRIGGEVKGIPLTKAGPKMDLTAALGGGFSSSTSTQTVAAQTTSKLSESITQSASFVASERSTVVFQTTASEQQTYQSRTIRNHNHCHTLTLMYYQVNRNYRVVTDYKGEREVILVKYDIKDFDAHRAYCNAEILKAALLDQSLIGCFDELSEALFCCDNKPAETPANTEMLIDSLLLKALPQAVQHYGHIGIDLYSATNGLIPLVTIDWIPVQWTAGGVFTQTVNLPTPIDAGQVAWMQVRLFGPVSLGPPPPFAILNEFEVLGHGPGHSDLVLYSSTTGTSITGSWRTPVEAKLPEEPPHVGVENECVEASCCIQKLLGHLNCHKRYYNAVLWLNEDPNERVMRWSCCGIGPDGMPLSLIAQIENTPITVYGDYLVFPVANGQLVDDPSVLPVTKIVTMPTPGVYSEGILGQCDTCEIIDPDRRWDWKDSPCPDNAPPVSSPPKPQTGVSLSDLKPDAITSLISFSTVPTVAETGIKELITTLLANADKGSAEAKALLDKLLDTIKESIPKPKETPVKP